MSPAGDEREFPIDIVLSVATGYVLTRDFSAVHACYEFLAGRTIGIREFANEGLCAKLSQKLAEQHPEFARIQWYTPLFEDASPSETWRHVDAYVASQAARLGHTIKLHKGG